MINFRKYHNLKQLFDLYFSEEKMLTQHDIIKPYSFHLKSEKQNNLFTEYDIIYNNVKYNIVLMYFRDLQEEPLAVSGYYYAQSFGIKVSRIVNSAMKPEIEINPDFYDNNEDFLKILKTFKFMENIDKYLNSKNNINWQVFKQDNFVGVLENKPEFVIPYDEKEEFLNEYLTSQVLASLNKKLGVKNVIVGIAPFQTKEKLTDFKILCGDGTNYIAKINVFKGTLE